MNGNRWWIALFAVLLCVGSVTLVGAQRTRSAGGGPIDPTCTSSSPCIQYNNTSTGPAVLGVSGQGRGLVGVTTFNSSSFNNSTSGVFGNDTSSSGAFNSGVRGASVRGIGVTGASTSGTGVRGTSTKSSGVLAGGGGALTVLDRLPALSLLTISKGDLIDGCTVPKNLSGGQCDSSNAVFSVFSTGYVTSAGGGQFNIGGIGTYGVYGQGTDTGIIGQCASFGLDEFWGQDSSGTTNFTVDCTGTPSSIVRTRNGSYATAIVPRSTSPVLEDYGEARLLNGTATVRLDPAFAETISNKTPYLVFVTPDGDTNGLYVANKTMLSFQVREIHGGRSTLVFDYRIVATPANDVHPRMAVMAHPPTRFAPARPRFQ